MYQVVTTLISLLACAGALWPWYSERMPFKPMISVGGVGVHFAQFPFAGLVGAGPEFDPIKNRVVAAFVLSVDATHAEGRHGTVDDMVLRVTRMGHADRWLFVPMLTIDEPEYLSYFSRSKNGALDDDALKWMSGVFAGIHLPRGTSVRRVLFFVPKEHEQFPAHRLRTGEYEVVALARVGETDYKEVGSQVVDFSQEKLKGVDGAVYYPVSKKLNDQRKAAVND